MILDLQFVLIASLIIALLIPLYIYRRQLYKRFYKSGDIQAFLKDVQIYLSVHHPKIPFDFSIVSKFKDEKDMQLQQTLIAEELVKQFAYYEFELKTQGAVSKDKLWNTYLQNSRLVKDNKLPSDWIKRKEVVWNREQGRCTRCGFKTRLVDSNILLVKQMKDGGGFNIENLVLLCSDCSRIAKSENLERTRSDLNIIDNLMKKVIA